jgi:hypothetical protein
MFLTVKPGDPVIDSFVSGDGKFGFVEMRTIQEATNALSMTVLLSLFGSCVDVYIARLMWLCMRLPLPSSVSQCLRSSASQCLRSSASQRLRSSASQRLRSSASQRLRSSASQRLRSSASQRLRGLSARGE